VFMTGEFIAERFEEHLIIDFADHVARLVQLSEDPSVRRLNEVADDLVIEVFHLLMHR